MKIKLNKKYLLSLKKHWLLLLGIIILGGIIQVELGVIYIMQQKENSSSLSTKTLAAYAADVIESCKGAPHRPSCYDETIPKLMDKISMEDAFKVTKLVQDQDNSYLYCHVLGHELSAREVQKNPNSWKTVISRCPSGQCSNGCIHGGFQERFRKESFTTDSEIEAIKPDLKVICEARSDWNPTGLEQASCYHALGHLTMYITNADLKKATTLCNEVAVKDDGRDFSQLCYDGAFMQIFQPLEPEDFALVKGKQPTKNTVKDLCNQFSDAEKSSCISESWPLFREEIQRPQGFIEHCSGLSGEQKDRCYSVLIYVITPLLNYDDSAIEKYCKDLPTPFQSTCYKNAASRMIETDYRFISRAVSLCSAAPSRDLTNACFSELLKYSTYNYHPSTEEFTNVCNSLPQPWKDQCITRGQPLLN